MTLMCHLVFFLGVFSIMYTKYNSFKSTITNYDIFLNCLEFRFFVVYLFSKILFSHIDVNKVSVLGFLGNGEFQARNKTTGEWAELQVRIFYAPTYQQLCHIFMFSGK